jgi:membrane protein
MLVSQLWLAQKDGRPLSYIDKRRRGMRTPQYQVNEIMGHLQQANWVQATGSGNWILSRDMDEVTVLDLYRIVPKPLPVAAHLEEDTATGEGLDAVLQGCRQALESNLAVPMSSLLNQKQEAN